MYEDFSGESRFKLRLYFESASLEQKHTTYHTLAFIAKGKAVAGLEWPRGFQEVKVPRFHGNGTGWW